MGPLCAGRGLADVWGRHAGSGGICGRWLPDLARDLLTPRSGRHARLLVALGAGVRCFADRRQDNTTASGQATSAVPMTRSARPVAAPLVVSSMRYQASKAKSVATAAADTADRRPHGTEGPLRHAPVGQAIRAMKVTPAHNPCVGEPPTCSGYAATSTPAAPAAARISRPGIAAGRSASAVAISHAPVTANAAVITHGSAASRTVRALTVLASQLKEGGCRAVATVHPPTRNTKAAAADNTPHQGTERPAATAGETRAASLAGACLPAAFTMQTPLRSLAQDKPIAAVAQPCSHARNDVTKTAERYSDLIP
jgi:hypothetical protein